MVRLKSYYSLCPLIDRRSFIGVSEDKDIGCGIVTLGKNVVNLYKLSDQKQIGGWTSKEHITAPVVFDDSRQEYVGVFNDSTIKTWPPECQSLEKLKKKKFNKGILCIKKDKNGTGTILFKDGDSSSLDHAIENRRSLSSMSIIKQNETIVDTALYFLNDIGYVGIVLKSNETEYVYLSYELNTDINTPRLDTVKRVPLKREELDSGKIIVVTIASKASPPVLYVLWSDGRLLVNDLIEDKCTLVGHVPWICHSLEASMTWIGGKHLAIFGADHAQEGALLTLYNVLFGVGACSHPLKLFCRGARLWCVWDYVLLEASQHLAVVPFILDNHRNMLALIGSDKDNESTQEILSADWGNGKSNWITKESWSEMALKGMTERDIASVHFPILINEGDTKSIINSLEKFIDIPESVIVALLGYVVRECGGEDTTQLNLDVDCKKLLNNILSLPYIQENMVHALRKHLTTEHMLYLVGHISHTMQHTDTDAQFEMKLILWATALIDSHYQQLVLSSSSGSKQVMLELESAVANTIDQLLEEQTIIPLLNSLVAGKSLGQTNPDETSAYFVEAVTLKGL